jgi:hypothetical protein
MGLDGKESICKMHILIYASRREAKGRGNEVVVEV